MQTRENKLAASCLSLSFSLLLFLTSDAVRDLAVRCNIFRARVLGFECVIVRTRMSVCVCMCKHCHINCCNITASNTATVLIKNLETSQVESLYLTIFRGMFFFFVPFLYVHMNHSNIKKTPNSSR